MTVSRRFLGWSASSLPVAPILLVGVFLGQQGLAILSSQAFAVIDPAAPVALAALGILAALDLCERRVRGGVLLAASWQAMATAAVVGSALAAALIALSPVAAEGQWILPIVAAVSAATSLTLPGRSSEEPQCPAKTLIGAEVVVAIVAGGLMLSMLRQPSLVDGARLLGQGIGVSALLALSGWLLLRPTSSETERRVFVVATLLLVGGSADYMSFSPLLAGLVAGFLWHFLNGGPRETLQRETAYAQHPFVVLVLLAAGARSEISTVTCSLAAVYASVRVVARGATGGSLERLVPSLPRTLRFDLIEPGVFGVAFALNVLRAVGMSVPGAGLTLSVVVIGTVLSDVVARLSSFRAGPV